MESSVSSATNKVTDFIAPSNVENKPSTSTREILSSVKDDTKKPTEITLQIDDDKNQPDDSNDFLQKKDSGTNSNHLIQPILEMGKVLKNKV